ncbi:MAG TPA: hypothetical protein PKC18_02425, partial [Lacipirellulaceae bacterium]|nr:hypothetical protein [Lacipirellulaceae bacterium]
MTPSPSDRRSSVVPWLPVVATAGAILAAGPPGELSDAAWRTAPVFAATIVGFITRPPPVGPMVLIGPA